MKPDGFDPGPTLVSIYLFKGDSVPVYLDFACTCLVPINNLTWIEHDPLSRTIYVYTEGTVFVGEHLVLVVQ